MKYYSAKLLTSSVFKTFLLTTLLCLGVLQGLKTQTTYSFSNANATGQFGPSQIQVNNAYSSTNLSGLVTAVSGIQSWTVPVTGLYRITGSGAQGGNSSNNIYTGGLGARIAGDFSLTAGSVIKVLVGQSGLIGTTPTTYFMGGGGGGGSYVTLNSVLILSASGGGGAGIGEFGANGFNGNPGITGLTGNVANGILGQANGTPGTNGFGGNASSYYGGGAGAGWLSNGGNMTSGITSFGGQAFFNNGAGGAGGTYNGATGGTGGFGGGGGAGFGGGGGGGYSGGASGTHGGNYNGSAGGGGGSYNNGINQINVNGINSGSGSVIITRLAGVSINQTSQILCNGQLTAVLTASATGGTAPYTYVWSPGGSTSQTLTGIGAGTYTCVATDASSISYTASYTVTQPSAFTSTLTSQTNLSCNGAGNGQLSVAASGGVGPYTYSWSPSGGTAATASSLSAGNYTCTIRDANNCITTKTATVTQPAPTSILGFATNPTVCLGQTTILLGAAALTYTWTGGAVNGVAFAPNASAIYTVTGTNGVGCNGTATVAVTVNPLPTLVISGSSVICGGNPANLSVTGANTYTWSDSSNGTTFSANPLTTTLYTVSGINGFGCINTAARTVTVVGALPVVTASASTNPVCLGKNTILYGGGATSYVWSGGVTNNVAFAPGISTIYTVTGTNACGSSTNTILINVNSLPNITANASSTAICAGGTAVLTGSGGVSYTWSGGVINGSTFLPSITNNYTVTGTDANGCQNTAIQQIIVNALPNITANTTSSTVCLGNSTTLFGGGGISYTWTGGVTDNTPFNPGNTATYIVTGIDGNGCQKTASRVITVINVPTLAVSASSPAICIGNTTKLLATGALSYTWTNGVVNNVFFSPTSTNTYTVYGSNTCGTTSNVITVTVNPLPAITANASNTSICIGNPVTLSGGAGISYTWTGGVTNGSAFTPGTTNTYTVTGVDANGCRNTAVKTVVVNALPTISANASQSIVCLGNTTTLFGGGGVTYTWTSGVTDNVPFSPLSTASYTVTGTDANGCQNTASRTLTVINVPALLVNASNPAVCLGNSTTLSGSGAISYTWTGGVTNNVPFTPIATDTYTLYGTNSCGTTSNVITVTVHPLPVVTANASNTVTCIGTSISLFGGGANTFTWTNGVSNNVPFIPAVTTTYTVTGTDANGCQNTAVKTLTVLSLPAVTASATSSAFCRGNSTTLNGNGALSYVWTGGILDNISFTPNVTTTYTVTGTDANGCQNTAVKTITVHQLPVVTANVTNSVICSSNSTSFYGSGANTYTWSGGIVNGALQFPTTNASYTVTGTNVLTGCTSTNLAVASVTVNALPSITLTPSNASICMGQSVSITASGATTYTFSGGISNGFPFTPFTTTTYFVTGRNTLTGCSNIAQQIITVNARPVVTASVSSAVICSGQSVIFNGSGANTYTWTGGVVNGLPFTPATSGSFMVTGTNTLTGCTSTNTASQYVTVNTAPTLFITVTNSSVCEGGNTLISVLGANGYTISNGVLNGIAFTPAATAVYTITGIHGITGCITTATRTIEVNPHPIVGISGIAPAVCAGYSTMLTASGADTYTISGGVLNGVPFIPTSTATYSVSGTNTLSGCISKNSAAITLSVHPLPFIFSFVSASVICEGTPVIFNANGADTYTWTNGPVNNTSYLPVLTNTYSVSGTNTLTGCTSTNSSVQSVSVNAAPGLTLSSTANDTLCSGETMTLTANGTGLFLWDTGETDEFIVVNPSSTTGYTVTLTSANGCEKSETITVNILDCTGLNSYSQKTGLSVYPNPNNGSFILKGISNTRLSLVNELGLTVKTIQLNETDEQTIQVEDLPAGIYFISGNKGNQFIKHKLVITK